MEAKAWYALGFGAIVLICITAFIISPGAEFGGADGQGEEQIAEIDPDYQPWFESLWSPPGETESLLFATQAAIGASIIGWFIGNEHGKKVANGRKDGALDGENDLKARGEIGPDTR